MAFVKHNTYDPISSLENYSYHLEEATYHKIQAEKSLAEYVHHKQAESRHIQELKMIDIRELAI